MADLSAIDSVKQRKSSYERTMQFSNDEKLLETVIYSIFIN